MTQDPGITIFNSWPDSRLSTVPSGCTSSATLTP